MANVLSMALKLQSRFLIFNKNTTFLAQDCVRYEADQGQIANRFGAFICARLILPSMQVSKVPIQQASSVKCRKKYLKKKCI